ncbi:aconitate hydratase AcnA [Pseudonocardia sp. DR1-2]|uniref:aconitate hydratase AcnA n=1 Tax=Pseudonocardia sp. DR1-2 TaxID=2951168 RepID=UPI0020440EB4|nr:aconitate hydratase AcnA [Pseudonocardia sp. DR1-2]MCM3850023.1 aconitate hydratase AcnA [Pseudonocardia sp. DR1-2]
MRDSFRTRSELKVDGGAWEIRSLAGLSTAARLPLSLRLLLENLLRNENGEDVTADRIEALRAWRPGEPGPEVAFTPSRVLLQDLSGVPVVLDIVAMRERVAQLGGDPALVAPRVPTDLVVDHSVIVDVAGRADAAAVNTGLEYARNAERYAFLRGAQEAFDNFRIVPPGHGICHQVNLEHLATVVTGRPGGAGRREAFPDTLVGTDSHTTMVNGLGVLGWGVGGIEAEAAMLGRALSMRVPAVVGVRLTGAPRPGVTSTDLVLTVTETLRGVGVVAGFVEFFGPGVAALPVEARATVANMSPEYGSTCALFPVDDRTLEYLRLTARPEPQIRLVERYAREQGLWGDPGSEADYDRVVELDLARVRPSVAGPFRPHDRLSPSDVPAAVAGARRPRAGSGVGVVPAAGATPPEAIGDGSVVIAAITSCTNTSAPAVMIGAGLLARNAVRRGMRPKPWVRTSLAPGSAVVAGYLAAAGLQTDLDALGFQLVGFGCTTCSGNSGPLDESVRRAVREGDLDVAAVLSGNRNFAGRIHPEVRMSFLASPPLVVAYALAGTTVVDVATDPLGVDGDGRPVHLADLWPTDDEIRRLTDEVLSADLYRDRYRDVFDGDERWNALAPSGAGVGWHESSTYIRRPPFFDDVDRMDPVPEDLTGARALLHLDDFVTTDHISPVGPIRPESDAGRYLLGRGVGAAGLHNFGARRGNHEVMVRGTFTNPHLHNRLTPDAPGGTTVHLPSGERTTVFEAAQRYRSDGTPLVVLAGSEYGTGSSRDWAAKGTRMLGVRAVLARSFERIHRSNLVGTGVLPLQFAGGESTDTLGLDGRETYAITGLADGTRPRHLTVTARGTGGTRSFRVLVRLDTPVEWELFRHGGIGADFVRGLVT